jgi:hypothetical protein
MGDSEKELAFESVGMRGTGRLGEADNNDAVDTDFTGVDDAMTRSGRGEGTATTGILMVGPSFTARAFPFSNAV